MPARRLPALLSALMRSALFPLWLACGLLSAYSAHAELPPTLTLLDEVGQLAGSIPGGQVTAWKRQLHLANLPAAEAAKLHLWLGEYKLAQEEQPEQALWHFRQAQQLSKPSEVCYGLAAYDSAVALMYAGAYHSRQPKLSTACFPPRPPFLATTHAGARSGIAMRKPMRATMPSAPSWESPNRFVWIPYAQPLRLPPACVIVACPSIRRPCSPPAG